ncbi:MAG: D-alanine--D-alanine ligase [Prevotellaceae bacterium]|nr:D-alanine--D-alanine ligase [Candidatus Faecinaster equi]
MKRIIAIVAGGDSSEHDVSMRSAQGILSFINKEQYEVYIIEIKGQTWEAILNDGSRSKIDKNDFSFNTPNGKIRPDFAYITIHGTPGENGILQGYFDLIQMPYSTSGVLVEALTFNKFSLNQYLKAWGIKVAESLLLRRKMMSHVSDDEIIEKVGLPCFVKPNADGSSFGVSKVKTKEELRPAIELALKEGDEVMVEAFMQGTEITCGCYKTTDKSIVFPITEVVTNEEFFNYDAKYNGAVQEITPARIAPETADRVSTITKAIYSILGCEGIIRIDYILTGEKGKEQINMLEVNTAPGMTATSFIPQQIRAAGLNIGDVLSDIIENKF